MASIFIKQSKENKQEWRFEVRVEDNNSDQDYLVTVPRDYYLKLTQQKIEPEELVKKSFEFLLARESKESILKSFSLAVIQDYFPEYELEIKKAIN